MLKIKVGTSSFRWCD